MSNPKVIGIIISLVIGVVWVAFGPLNALLVALFVLIGWFVSKIVTGEIDIAEQYDRFMAGKGKRPRS